MFSAGYRGYTPRAVPARTNRAPPACTCARLPWRQAVRTIRFLRHHPDGESGKQGSSMFLTIPDDGTGGFRIGYHAPGSRGAPRVAGRPCRCRKLLLLDADKHERLLHVGISRRCRLCETILVRLSSKLRRLCYVDRACLGCLDPGIKLADILFAIGLAQRMQRRPIAQEPPTQRLR